MKTEDVLLRILNEVRNMNVKNINYYSFRQGEVYIDFTFLDDSRWDVTISLLDYITEVFNLLNQSK